MKIITLTEQEQQQVHSLAREIRKMHYAELDKIRAREDFYGIFSDIVQELQKNCNSKIEMFYEFAELSNEKLSLVSPEMSYGYGKMAKQEGLDLDDGYSNFLLDATKKIIESEVLAKSDKLLYNLTQALGSAHSLITEFVSMHAEINIESTHAKHFFDSGYKNAIINVVC